MGIENRLGLPEPIVRAVANDGYSRGDADISITQLIAPPRQVALIAKHADEITEDASDRIFSLLGQAVHSILERGATLTKDTDEIREKRLTMEVGGWKVSGAFDHLALADGGLSDYKVTSVWQVIFAADKREWQEQLNCYAELARRALYDIKALRIVAILRDWSKRKAQTDPDYPQQQVAVIPIPLWPREQTVAYLEERVRLHQAARTTLPVCTDEEVWRKPTTWAVMKPGVKKAVRVLPTLSEATTYAGRGHTVVERPGEATRCLSYCPVAPFCDQWKEENTNDAA